MGSTSNIINNTADCFLLGENEIKTEVTEKMLHEMKRYSPGPLIFYAFVNISLGLVSCIGNALVVLTVAIFSELHIVSNIGLASLATVNFFHGLILHLSLFAISVNVLVGDGCRLFRSTRFVIFYFSYVFLYCAILHLCIVSAERYIGVVHSLRYHAILPKERLVKLLVAAWVASSVLSIPAAINSLQFQNVGKVIWIVTVVLSLAVMFYCNFKIFVISRRHRRQVQTQAQAVHQMAAENQQRFRGAGTTFYIVLTLIICHVPGITTRIVKPFVDEDTLTRVKPWTSTVFAMYSSVSPFVYFFRCKRLRRYSKKLLRKAVSLISCNNFF